MSSSRIGVVGAGYVGLTTAACMASLGHNVVCGDVDVVKLAALSRGDVPILEPGLPELVHRPLTRGDEASDHGADLVAVVVDVVVDLDKVLDR